MKTIFITVGCIVAGATIGGICGYQINGRNWDAIKDPESLLGMDHNYRRDYQG
jgi:hypothetical protein